MLSTNRFKARGNFDISKYPTVFQAEKFQECSDKYKFIPTSKAVEILQDNGWSPVGVQEARCRIEDKLGYQKHAVTFRNESMNKSLVVGEVLPQIVLVNSHCGNASFQLLGSLYRCVCSNQLVVQSENFSDIRVRHAGYSDMQFEAATRLIADQLPQMLESSDKMKAIELSQEERLAYASSAIDLRFDGDTWSVDPKDVIHPYRREDQPNNLWATYNTVQENLIKGRVWGRNQENKWRRARAVKGLDKDLSINRALWRLAEEMAKIKGQELH